MRLIDADALIAEIDGMIKNAQSMGGKFDLAVSYGLIGGNGVIKDAPTIETTEQVTGKLKNPCDSLLTEDSEDAKEQKSKLKGKSADICIIDEPIVDHDRGWIIGCIEHDGFIHTHRFDKANQIILDALSAEQGWIPCSERLPEIACRCLVTLSNNVVAVGTLHGDGEYEDDFGRIVSWGKRWHLEPTSMMIAYPEDSVIAWQPLPKPYKGGDDK